MNEYRRAINLKEEKNRAAIVAANAAIAGESGGRRLTMGPEDARLRKEWMDAYIAAGGEYKVVKPRHRKPNDNKAKCPVPEKTVRASVVTLTFRSDHLDDAGKKLLKPSAGDYKDSTSEFQKPEWDKARGDSSDSYPISHNKGKEIKIDLEVEFEVKPGGTANWTAIKGFCAGKEYLTFEKTLSQSVTTKRYPLKELVSKGKLPNYVDLVTGSIDWTVVVDSETKHMGTTGPHKIYVTFDKPHGKMGSMVANVFDDSIGDDQDIAEERLKFSVEAAKEKGKENEKECVDAIFDYLKEKGVHYQPFRWTPGSENATGMTPKPSLHHYLWKCNVNEAKGECHNLAAAFILASRILGVKDPFEVGKMYPWPSRKDEHPIYPKRGDRIQGKYNTVYRRNHAVETTPTQHGWEHLMFLDGSELANNFEAVAKYRNALYAIGEDKYDKYSTDDENASAFYAEVKSDGSADWTKGYFKLFFYDDTNDRVCRRPYPWKTIATFKWEE